MDKIYTLADFDKTIRQLGEIYFAWVQSQVQPKIWREAILEARYASDGSYWDDKMRVEAENGEVISLKTTQPIHEILTLLNKMRGILGWYSFRMQIESNGSVSVKYGYDPKYIDDSSFFEN